MSRKRAKDYGRPKVDVPLPGDPPPPPGYWFRPVHLSDNDDDAQVPYRLWIGDEEIVITPHDPDARADLWPGTRSLDSVIADDLDDPDELDPFWCQACGCPPWAMPMVFRGTGWCCENHRKELEADE